MPVDYSLTNNYFHVQNKPEKRFSLFTHSSVLVVSNKILFTISIDNSESNISRLRNAYLGSKLTNMANIENIATGKLRPFLFNCLYVYKIAHIGLLKI